MKSGPAIILGTLISTLILSMAAIALIILFNQNRPSTEELAAACKSEVGDAISAEYDKVAEACKAEATNTVPSAINHPGFDYPASWTAVGNDRIEGATPGNTIHVTPGFLNYCEGCDGPYIPVILDTYQDSNYATFTSLREYVAHFYGDAEFYSNLAFNEEKLAGKDVVVVTGHSTGLFDQDFEHIYFASTKYIASVKLGVNSEVTNKKEIQDGWTVIKSSLDFSKVE